MTTTAPLSQHVENLIVSPDALLRFAHADFFYDVGREAEKKMGHRAGANAYVIKPNVSHMLGSIVG